MINAGGIINVYAELENYGQQEIIRKTENIYNTTLEILNNAEANDVTTHQAALDIAQARIDARKKKNNLKYLIVYLCNAQNFCALFLLYSKVLFKYAYKKTYKSKGVTVSICF